MRKKTVGDITIAPPNQMLSRQSNNLQKTAQKLRKPSNKQKKILGID